MNLYSLSQLIFPKGLIHPEEVGDGGEGTSFEEDVFNFDFREVTVFQGTEKETGCVLEILNFALTGKLPKDEDNGKGTSYFSKVLKGEIYPPEEEKQVKIKLNLRSLSHEGDVFSVEWDVHLGMTGRRVSLIIGRNGKEMVKVEDPEDARVTISSTLGLSPVLLKHSQLIVTNDLLWPLNSDVKGIFDDFLGMEKVKGEFEDFTSRKRQLQKQIAAVKEEKVEVEGRMMAWMKVKEEEHTTLRSRQHTLADKTKTDQDVEQMTKDLRRTQEMVCKCFGATEEQFEMSLEQVEDNLESLTEKRSQLVKKLETTKNSKVEELIRLSRNAEFAKILSTVLGGFGDELKQREKCLEAKVGKLKESSEGLEELKGHHSSVKQDTERLQNCLHYQKGKMEMIGDVLKDMQPSVSCVSCGAESPSVLKLAHRLGKRQIVLESDMEAKEGAIQTLEERLQALQPLLVENVKLQEGKDILHDLLENLNLNFHGKHARDKEEDDDSEPSKKRFKKAETDEPEVTLSVVSAQGADIDLVKILDESLAVLQELKDELAKLDKEIMLFRQLRDFWLFRHKTPQDKDFPRIQGIQAFQDSLFSSYFHLGELSKNLENTEEKLTELQSSLDVMGDVPSELGRVVNCLAELEEEDAYISSQWIKKRASVLKTLADVTRDFNIKVGNALRGFRFLHPKTALEGVVLHYREKRPGEIEYSLEFKGKTSTDSSYGEKYVLGFFMRLALMERFGKALGLDLVTFNEEGLKDDGGLKGVVKEFLLTAKNETSQDGPFQTIVTTTCPTFAQVVKSCNSEEETVQPCSSKDIGKSNEKGTGPCSAYELGKEP